MEIELNGENGIAIILSERLATVVERTIKEIAAANSLRDVSVLEISDEIDSGLEVFHRDYIMSTEKTEVFIKLLLTAIS